MECCFSREEIKKMASHAVHFYLQQCARFFIEHKVVPNTTHDPTTVMEQYEQGEVDSKRPASFKSSNYNYFYNNINQAFVVDLIIK